MAGWAEILLLKSVFYRSPSSEGARLTGSARDWRGPSTEIYPTSTENEANSAEITRLLHFTATPHLNLMGACAQIARSIYRDLFHIPHLLKIGTESQ